MEDERDDLAGYIATNRPRPSPTEHRRRAERDYRGPTPQPPRSAAWPAAIGQPRLSRAGAERPVRRRSTGSTTCRTTGSAATHSLAPALTVIDDYSEAIADLFTLNDQIAQGSSDPTLANNVRALGALSRTEDEASQQRGILYAALLDRQFEPGAAGALTSGAAQQAAEFAEFQSDASIDEQQIYSNTVAGAAG